MANHPELDNRSLGQFLRRGWPYVVVAVIVCVLAAAAVTAMMAKQYTAQASVSVTPTGVEDTATLANSRTTGVINMDTEAQLVTSAGVARRVQRVDKKTGSLTVARLVKNVAVSVPANTTVLTISYTAGSAHQAARGANAFAAAYLAQRSALAQTTLNAEISKVKAALASLNAQVKSTTNALSTLSPRSAQAAFDRMQLSTLRGQIHALAPKLSKLYTTVITPGTVRTPAAPPRAPSSPSRILNYSAGAGVGLLLGLFAAWLRLAVRRRLRTEDDVHARLRLPVLGTITSASASASIDSAAPAFQEYRRLANIVSAAIASETSEAGASEGRRKVVLVTGECSPRTTGVVAGNLARAFAAAGSTAAVTATSDDATAELAEYPELRDALVMLPRNASLDANTLSRMAGAGYLVVAAHDASRSADAQTVARSSDAALIVIEEGTTGLAADAVLAQLDAVSAPVLGAVLAPPARWWRRSEHFAKTRPSRAEPQPRRVDVDGPPNEPTASGDGTRVPASAPIRHKR